MDNKLWGVDLTLPDELFIGEGAAFYCKGWIYQRNLKIRSVTLLIDNSHFPMEEIAYPRSDVLQTLTQKGVIENPSKPAICCGFSGCFDLLPGREGQKSKICFIATFENGEEFVFGEKEIYFQKKEEYYRPIQIKNEYDTKSPLVSICMATYQPDVESFQIQIDSIRKQSYENWICIITDDYSDKKSIDSIRNTIKEDNRFYFYQNTRNLGYYRNFEQALKYTPTASQLIAFCDQDDYWYPDKLEKLVSKITSNPDYKLAYSDTRIVNDDGKMMSETYWNTRTNYYNDLSMVLLCNTVAGAATLFKRELLDKALPLPFQTSESYHDHVFACTALANGKIGYVDEPLYDYVQHGQNVIGHMELVNVGKNSFAQLVLKNIKSRHYFRDAVESLKDNFEINYIRLRLLARTLELRGSREAGKLGFFNNRLSGIIRLLVLHFRVRFHRLTTDNAELAVLFSLIARKLYRFISCVR